MFLKRLLKILKIGKTLIKLLCTVIVFKQSLKRFVIKMGIFSISTQNPESFYVPGYNI